MAQRILVVDDDMSIVKILKGYLEQLNFQVFIAYDGDMALHILRREHPDLIILDLMMPKRNGWEITRIIRSDKSLVTTPIIMLTARVDNTDKIVGLELGADDYITKPFIDIEPVNAHEVVARVKSLLRRVKLDQSPDAIPHVMTFGQLKLDLDQRSLCIGSRFVDLTRTEFALLEALMINPGYTLTRDELLQKALGYAYEGLGRTLDTHIRNLRLKIEPNPESPTYIQTVYGVGYRLIGDSG